MFGRALILAAVALLVSDLAAAPAQAQNLEAGKTPSQIFAGTCTACHKSPRGLLKSVPAGSLPGFLRQHYTTSPEMAGVLSSYLISNGASDTKYLGGQGKSDKPEAKPAPVHRGHASTPDPTRAESEQATGPDAKSAADAAEPQAQPGRKSRHRKRLAKPADDSAIPAEPRSSTANTEPAERSPAMRPDPVPAVTPAPASSSGTSATADSAPPVAR